MTKFKKLAITVLFAVFCLGVFVPSVLAETDKTLLVSQKGAIDTIILNSTLYRDNSYQAFSDDLTALGGTVAIQTMIDDALASQIDIDSMTSSLAGLLDSLVSKAVYNQVNLDYFAAVNADTAVYTLRSIALYEDELAQINVVRELIIDTPRIGDAALMTLDDDIHAAADLLVLLGDKTDLNVQWVDATAIDSGTGVNYTPSSFLLFQTDFDLFVSEDIPGIAFTVSEIVALADASADEVAAAVSEIEIALAMLVSRADKTVLEANYQEALTVVATPYIPSTYALFSDGLAEILIVINDPEVSNAIVDATIDELALLYDLLVLRTDKTALQTAYSEALNVDEVDYTPASFALFTAGLADVLAIINDPEASVATVASSVDALALLYEILIPRSDKTELNRLNDQIIIAYYEEKTLYTDSSYDAFRTAVLAFGHYLAVNEVLANLNAIQAEVDALALELQSALELLEERADVTALSLVYSGLFGVDLAPYTPASGLIYTQTLEAALLVMESTDTNQALADSTTLTLEQLNTILVLRADLTEVERLVGIASALEAAKYTPSSWQTLELHLQIASVDMLDPNVSQTDIDEIVAKLTVILDSLIITHKPIVIRANALPYDIDSFVFVFESTIVGYFSSNPDVLTVNGFGEVVGHGFGTARITVQLANGVTDTIDIIVKADLTPLTIVLASITPVVAAGLAFSLLWLPRKKITFLKKNFRIRKK